MSDSYSLYVGIDISADKADAVWTTAAGRTEGAYCLAQSRKGHKALIERLGQTGHPAAKVLVVMEATSTYWMQLAVRLYRAGYRVSVVNPRQSHHFAQALLKRAKTDAIDAQTLAELAILLKPAVWQPPSPAWEALYQRLVEHDNLVEARQMARNQLHALRQRHAMDKPVATRKQHLLDTYDQQIKQVAHEIQHGLDDSEWAAIARRVRTIKGIGLLSAAWLVVITNGFTTCQDADQLASYLGLVPHPQDSGKSRRGHLPVGVGGHRRARRVLYQAAVSAARFNGLIRSFYQHLIDLGKPVKVARCAAARKLVVAAFAVAIKEPLCLSSPIPA